MAISQYKPPAANFTLEDRKKLCNDWAKSNLSRSEFIRKHDLPKSFHHWCNKLLPLEQDKKIADNVVDPAQWLQIVPQKNTAKNHKRDILETSSIATEQIQVNFDCSNLKFNFNLSIEQAITFIKELNDATTVIR